MDAIRSLLALVLVLAGVFSVAVWASWFNDNLNFMGWAAYAKDYPMDPSTGPIAVGFGCIIAAYVIYPGGGKSDDRR